MTVCIVAICKFSYCESDLGSAILAASDRMLTSNDVQYEPQQMKLGALSKRVSVFTSGSMHIHSEALRATQRCLSDQPQDEVRDLAELYAANVRGVRLRIAAQSHLAPYGLDELTFLSAQRDMKAELVLNLANRMQEVLDDASEAIVAGIGPTGSPDLFYINSSGVATCHTDEGFFSIGNGGGHARLQMMLAGYSQYTFNYVSALATVYAAKRAAETAPGVGKETDMLLIVRDGSELIIPPTMKILWSIYNKWDKSRRKLAASAITELSKQLAKGSVKPSSTQ